MDRTMPTVKEAVQKIIEAFEWLDDCPFGDSEILQEAIQNEVEGLEDLLLDAATEEYGQNSEKYQDLRRATKDLGTTSLN